MVVRFMSTGSMLSQSEKISLHFDEVFSKDVLPMTKEEEIAAAVEKERQRCAACAQYELDACEYRAARAEPLNSFKVSYQHGAKVAEWIQKAILRGDTNNTFRGGDRETK